MFHRLLTLTLAPALVAAPPDVPPPHPFPGPPPAAPWLDLPRLDRSLDLTPAQQHKLKPLLESGRQALDAKRKAFFQARRALGEALDKPEATEALLLERLAAKQAAETALFKEERAQRALVMALLTPAQAATLKALRPEPPERPGCRPGPGGPPWGEPRQGPPEGPRPPHPGDRFPRDLDPES